MSQAHDAGSPGVPGRSPAPRSQRSKWRPWKAAPLWWRVSSVTAIVTMLLIMVTGTTWLPRLFTVVSPPTPTPTTSSGMRFATREDIPALRAALVKVPHITHVSIFYDGPLYTKSRPAEVLVSTDLPSTVPVDDPTERQLRVDIERALWRLPFDMGPVTFTGYLQGGATRFDLGVVRLETMFGRYGTPSPIPTR